LYPSQHVLDGGLFQPENLLEILNMADNMAADDARDARKAKIESQEFYELMQAYRHAPAHRQDLVIAAFEAVKAFIR
jgi:hypothetical protein